jgi:tetratricopeptide (TPR) repeat protein
LETLKLVCLDWISQERDKYIWEDLYEYSWDEIIGRMYLLKVHAQAANGHYEAALLDLEQALSLFAKEGVRQSYYFRALADKALLQCFLGQYTVAISTSDQAFTLADPFYIDTMMDNRCSMLVLAGAFSDALELLQARLGRSSGESHLRFTRATCLLHLERYNDAIAAYEQVIAEDTCYYGDEGLKAALRRQQPDWDDL